jgi:ADP-L-glycero-D-manno-heptose 6-epimerase
MIILTGGAGFIGSCVLAELNANDYSDILVVDNLGTGNKWKNLANKRFSGFLHKGQFLNWLYSEHHKQIDAIIHLGACSNTTEVDANYLMENNYLYSVKVAQYATKHNIRFIYASSAATYGNGENGYSDLSIDWLVPLNCYGMSKHLFDMWALENGLLDRITGLKFFNVFGANEYHKAGMMSMFVKAYEQIKECGKVGLFKSERADYADGEQKRDFIYVKDCAKIIMLMLTDKTWTGIYNIGTGKAESWNTLAESVFAAMEIEPNIEYIDMPPELSKQYQYFTEADNAKLLTKLGKDWRFTSIQDATKDYVQNYLMEKSYL